MSFSSDFKNETGLSFGLIVSAILAVVLALGIFMNTYTIDEGERAVVTRLGTVTDTWNPGIHVKVPFIDDVTTYNVRVQKVTFGKLADSNENVENLSAYSNDNQIIESYRLSITWAYDPARISDVYKYFGTKEGNGVFNTVVSPLVQQCSKTVFGQYTATTIVQERARLDKQLDDLLKEQLKKYPINIISVQIENVDFSKTFEDMIEQTARKKQEVEKAKSELKMQEILTKTAIAKAEAENQAIKLQSDAKAYQITVEAKAEAEAIKIKAEALRTNKELIELTVAEKWDGKLPQYNMGNSVPLLNLTK